MQLEYPCKDNGLPIIGKREIDAFGQRILKEYVPDALETPMSLDIKYPSEECVYLDIKEAPLFPEDLLGFIAFDDTIVPIKYNNQIYVDEGTIVLDSKLKENMTRWRFTAAHELSHWILHRSYHRRDKRNYSFRSGNYSYVSSDTYRSECGKKNPKKAETDDEWAEWQVDNLAAALLMPKKFRYSVANAKNI